MRRAAATVLVLGDPGPVRDELLLRPEVDVVWSATFEDALELLEVYRVEACIVAPEFEHVAGFEGFHVALADVPCLVRRPRAPDASAGDPREEVEDTLAFLAHHTGLVFARYPRARLSLPVTMEVHGDKFELETLNLSVSGAAVRPFPAVAEGARVELCIELPTQPLYLLARVVRVHAEDGEPRAGLSFTDLAEGPRAALARCVEGALPSPDEEERLFGELEIPMPRLRALSDGPVEAAPTPSLPGAGGLDPVFATPAMRSVEAPSGPTESLVPAWFDFLSEEMSDIERRAATGGDAPDWAHRVLRLRISLARARSETSSGEIPLSLVDEAYQMFAGLARATADAPLETQQQVSSIRASLLRDVLGEVA